jgi:hypothetical protein
MANQLVGVYLSSALPSIQTLNKLISSDGTKINEGQLRFDSLKNYFHRIDVEYGFDSEDFIGVIRKISYD